MNYKSLFRQLSELVGMAHAGVQMTECDKSKELFFEIETKIDELFTEVDIMEKQERIDRKHDEAQKAKQSGEVK